MITATANSDGTVDLLGYQGTTWEFTVSVFSDTESTVPVDLTGYTVAGQMRKDYQRTSSVLIQFVCGILPYDAVTNPDNNKVSVSVLPSVSSAVKVLSGVYDVEITKGVFTERIIKGKLTIDPEVTRL